LVTILKEIFKLSSFNASGQMVTATHGKAGMEKYVLKKSASPLQVDIK
jgi:hypothetical protein